MGRDGRPMTPRPRGSERAWGLSRRNRRRLTVALVAGVLLALGGGGLAWWTSRTSRAGDMAPPFTLPASTGNTVRLEDYREKQPVLLVFYMVGT